QDAGSGHLVRPTDDPAFGIEAGRDLVVVEGPIAVALDIRLSGPDHFQWEGYLLCQGSRDADILGLQPTAEAAADHVAVDRHLALIDAGRLRRFVLSPARHLGPTPDIDPIGPYMNGAVDRLHRRVSQEGELIGRVEFHLCARNRSCRITFN